MSTFKVSGSIQLDPITRMFVESLKAILDGAKTLLEEAKNAIENTFGTLIDLVDGFEQAISGMLSYSGDFEATVHCLATAAYAIQEQINSALAPVYNAICPSYQSSSVCRDIHGT